ncbi:MAG: hypothetical protein EZS28_006792 [Streblomastix strix]|uniref:Uncharacterized protein n=1 Tax=Streblomastix strix TaxID=222440 RepID=A0A5J4WT44_9EUKA|nr:MAG: hypothetical protein EZS28_006792 [Streblomastix strix]
MIIVPSMNQLPELFQQLATEKMNNTNISYSSPSTPSQVPSASPLIQPFSKKEEEQKEKGREQEEKNQDNEIDLNEHIQQEGFSADIRSIGTIIHGLLSQNNQISDDLGKQNIDEIEQGSSEENFDDIPEKYPLTNQITAEQILAVTQEEISKSKNDGGEKQND